MSSVTLGERLRDAGGSFARNARSRNLRRAQLCFGLAWAAEWAFTVSLSIVAFRDGGAAAVGVVTVLRLVPSGVVSPFSSTLADRLRRDVVLGAIGLARAATLGLSAAWLFSGGGPLLVYILAVAASIAFTPFRAAHSALLPSLCQTPEDLASANVVRGMLDSIGMLVGPVAAAGLLAAGGPEAGFGVAAGASLVAAALIRGLRYDEAPRPEATGDRPGVWLQARLGARALRAERDAALVLGLGVVQTFMRGCLTVFSVVIAIDLLDMGDAGVGLLNGAIGAGAVIGSVGASLLVASRRLGAWLGLAVALWGTPFALIGVFPSQAAALGLLGCVGLGNALLDVALFSLVGRLVPDDVLARVFGVFESMIAIAVGLGAIATPLAIDGLGVRGALVLLGLVCPAAAVVALARLRTLDRTMETRSRDIESLRRVPMLRTLPVVTIEQLARHVRHSTVPGGAELCVQGSPGDTFYVIEEGEADVLGDGRQVNRLGPGDSFGEIALLRDTPRTATVRAVTTLRTAEITRDFFVPIVSGYGPAAGEAEATIGNRLDTFGPFGAAV